MKKLLIVFVLLFAISGYSQKKSAKHVFKVDGVCGMCKERIEKASLDTKGVKFAVWNQNTHQLTVILNEKKNSIKTVKENIAKVGHDSDDIKATKEVYGNMHNCCKYRTEAPKCNFDDEYGH